jgi:transcription initiation factor TFIID subunit 2
MDHFTMTYGSYPFSIYKLCFVDDLVMDCVDTATLSILSNRILFPQDIIDPIDRVTRRLVYAVACQWLGVNIIPKEPADTWAIVGMGYFITDKFIRTLAGNNEYRYQQKKASDRVCEIDVARPSIYDTGKLLWLDPSQAEFLALKAPLVLFILDRRLVKASGSSGLSRIISRVFLNAKTGDLENGALTTAYFQRICEKTGHAKLDTFFSQWVYGAGCPLFRVSQRFNKKRLVVEMMIHQVQADRPLVEPLNTDTFMRDVKEDLQGVFAGPVQPAFMVRYTGSNMISN